MATIEDDRRWVTEQYWYLAGRAPRPDELDARVASLQQGMPRSEFMRVVETWNGAAKTTRLYQEVLGRVPTAAELQSGTSFLESGGGTLQQLRERVGGSTQGTTRSLTGDPEAAGQEDAMAYLRGVLNRYGLGSLATWAWRQIQAGHSSERILQDLRDTKEYKQRFVGMELRQQRGLPAVSEAEYIAYETSVRQMMRAAGMPADFYDKPDDFAKLIGNDVSVAEMQSRVNDGYLTAMQAPAEVRQQLQALYGVSTGGLAAFFLDPDRALPLIERQFAASQMSGSAIRSGYGALDKTEAERIAALGVSEADAQGGFSALAQSKELFGSLPGEDAALIDRVTQQNAVFGGDANARSAIDKRAKERVSQGSGAQSFTVGQGGVAALGRE